MITDNNTDGPPVMMTPYVRKMREMVAAKRPITITVSGSDFTIQPTDDPKVEGSTFLWNDGFAMIADISMAVYDTV